MIRTGHAMFGPLGFPEVLFILVLALLIFGPKRLPEVGRTIGKGMAQFRRATTDLKRTIENEIDLEDERPVRAAPRLPAPAPAIPAPLAPVPVPESVAQVEPPAAAPPGASAALESAPAAAEAAIQDTPAVDPPSAGGRA
jgi:TatA/E family protein of Tat protein translocase